MIAHGDEDHFPLRIKVAPENPKRGLSFFRVKGFRGFRGELCRLNRLTHLGASVPVNRLDEFNHQNIGVSRGLGDEFLPIAAHIFAGPGDRRFPCSLTHTHHREADHRFTRHRVNPIGALFADHHFLDLEDPALVIRRETAKVRERRELLPETLRGTAADHACPDMRKQKRKRAGLYAKIANYYNTFLLNGTDQSGERGTGDFMDFYKTLHSLNQFEVTQKSTKSDLAAAYLISREITIEIMNYAEQFLKDSSINKKMLNKELEKIEERTKYFIKEKKQMEELYQFMNEAKQKIEIADSFKDKEDVRDAGGT